jgi:hypothetical protein
MEQSYYSWRLVSFSSSLKVVELVYLKNPYMANFEAARNFKVWSLWGLLNID